MSAFVFDPDLMWIITDLDKILKRKELELEDKKTDKTPRKIFYEYMEIKKIFDQLTEIGRYSFFQEKSVNYIQEIVNKASEILAKNEI